MKLNYVANINFKANYFKLRKYGQNKSLFVMTDNSENLGKKPVCETKLGSSRMVYDGKYYTSITPIYYPEYKIKFKDTGKYENNGVKKSIDYQKICEIVDGDGLNDNFAFVSGVAKGKLVKAKNLDVKTISPDVPLILICDNEEECYKHFRNADGIILKSESPDLLSHFAAICRDYCSLGIYIGDKNLLKNLEKLEGQFISISNKFNDIEYKPIAPFSKSLIEEKVDVPSMKRVDKILSLDECEKDIVGNKAYNLKRMTNLVKEGKLKDVVIPNAFVLPYAYLERVESFITDNSKNLLTKNLNLLEEIKDYSKDIISNKYVIVRSAFNGEDLEGYSAAGLYDSKISNIQELTLEPIYKVIKSKDSPIAVSSRRRHGISDDEIKPCVIIQDFIFSDFSFTTYTQSPNDKDKMLVELYINDNRRCKPDPYLILYDRKLNKFFVQKEHSAVTEYIFDENYNLIRKIVIQNNCLDKLLPTLENLVNNALVLEKEFGAAQDIEGGIKNGQLYFWQSRNIVQKKEQTE